MVVVALVCLCLGKNFRFFLFKIVTIQSVEILLQESQG